jgi:hypothetical protein
VAPLSEVEKGLAGELAVINRRRLDHDASATLESLSLAHTIWAELGFDHHGQQR